jgi:hypothetical protein
MKKYFFIYLFFSKTLLASPCGLEGTIEERIKDCNVTKENFVLVFRDDKGQEIYRDTKTDLFWGDRLSVDFNHYGSQKACDSVEHSLKGLHWRLPTMNEFETASLHGMKSALPRIDLSYWTSTPVKVKRRGRRNRNPARNFIWEGAFENAESGDLRDAASVRCVARP